MKTDYPILDFKAACERLMTDHDDRIAQTKEQIHAFQEEGAKIQRAMEEAISIDDFDKYNRLSHDLERNSFTLNYYIETLERLESGNQMSADRLQAFADPWLKRLKTADNIAIKRVTKRLNEIIAICSTIGDDIETTNNSLTDLDINIAKQELYYTSIPKNNLILRNKAPYKSGFNLASFGAYLRQNAAVIELYKSEKTMEENEDDDGNGCE